MASAIRNLESCKEEVDKRIAEMEIDINGDPMESYKTAYECFERCNTGLKQKIHERNKKE